MIQKKNVEQQEIGFKQNRKKYDWMSQDVLDFCYKNIHKNNYNVLSMVWWTKIK